MKLYVHDGIPGDQRTAHNSGTDVSVDELPGVLAYHMPSLGDVDALARARDYKNRDTVCVTVEGLGGPESYEQKLKMFYAEHLHEDEEIRYVLDGEGFFDIRDRTDRWVRILVEKSDLLIVPAGVYHRFTPTESNYIKALRLFRDEPKWEAKPRPEADGLPIRQAYLQSSA